MRIPVSAVRSLALLVGLILCSSGMSAYSVLTHEQIIDLLWKDQIQPLLLQRFPGTGADALRQAHAYAYGGSVVQDMGYYPFGNKYFSDLVHYARGGDFVEALLRDSSDVNEYAFALGALAHYVSDNCGHPFINRITAIEFPKMHAKFGDVVTYADSPKDHIRTEFGFDMVQVARNRYTSDSYHDFIGFQVSKPLLERAFQETYGIKLDDLFNVDLGIGSFRRAMSRIIPEMTRVALLSRRDEIVKERPDFNKKKFLYYLSRSDYRREWGTVYRKPGIGTIILAFFLKIVPKVGPFRAVNFKIPTSQTEDMYIRSVNQTVEQYSHELTQAGRREVDLPNLDFDTGRPTQAGEYPLADKTYARLLNDLSNRGFANAPRAMCDDILRFYSNPNAPIATKRDKKRWKQLLDEVSSLSKENAAPAPVSTPVPSR
jgi:zinc dependent phospholipase C